MEGGGVENVHSPAIPLGLFCPSADIMTDIIKAEYRPRCSSTDSNFEVPPTLEKTEDTEFIKLTSLSRILDAKLATYRKNMPTAEAALRGRKFQVRYYKGSPSLNIEDQLAKPKILMCNTTHRIERTALFNISLNQ